MRRRDRPRDRWLIEYLKENAAFRRYVLRELEQRGRLLSREIADHEPSRREAHRWWGERKMGLMLGILNARGEVAVVGRQGKQRMWDLAERWYPPTETVRLPTAKRLLLDDGRPSVSGSRRAACTSTRRSTTGPCPRARRCSAPSTG
jgi:uncharacterized protein YcaQ